MKLKKIAALLAAAGPMVVAAPAFATNGMNMEGYGPVATGMGGAAMAYDNGTAGMINNAATLGLMKSGTSRLDIALGGLHPDVTAKDGGPFGTGRSAKSGGDAYFMPAIGYVRKDGGLTWGIGLMSQGGMGTEWGTTSWLGDPLNFGAGINRDLRTELGVGRVMIPLAFDLSPNFRLGGSLDYVWAGLDARFNFDAATFGAMAGNINNATPGIGKKGVGYASAATFGPSGIAATMLGWGTPYFYIDMSEGTNKFRQQLTGSAFSANLGFVWTASDKISVGGTYRPQVKFTDLSGSASITGIAPGGAAAPGPLRGNMKIVDFKWPSTIGVGISYQATDNLQIVADYKNIGWKEAMQQFHMKFTGGGLVGEFGLNQNWKDQNVLALGLSYKATKEVTLRVGANLTNQPVNESNMTPYFPATVTNAYTFGLGFATGKDSSFDVSATMSPKVGVKSVGCVTGGAVGQQGFPGCPGDVSTSHGQTNWQAMFSQRF